MQDIYYNNSVTEDNELLVQSIPCATLENQSKHQSDLRGDEGGMEGGCRGGMGGLRGD